MERITLSDFVVIAEGHCGIDAHQLVRIDRVRVLAESALAAPFAGFGDIEVFPAFHAKAAIYLCRIATYHPLPDGNKRTAYDVMREFVERNGRSFSHEDGDLMATAEVVERIAARSKTEAEAIEWMAERVGRFGEQPWPRP
jgi:death-on-curing protein